MALSQTKTTVPNKNSVEITRKGEGVIEYYVITSLGVTAAKIPFDVQSHCNLVNLFFFFTMLEPNFETASKKLCYAMT